MAQSGEVLIERAERAAPGDSALQSAADGHREALSASLRQSRLWSFMTERFLRVLPLVAVVLAAAIGGLASLAAGRLSKRFSRPVGELVEWTERIARSEPLPEGTPESAEVREFVRLREALRKMDDELADARRREVESARLRAWTQMARGVAHEIKNPLTPMSLAAGMLAKDAEGPAREAADVLLEEIGRLDEMARTFAQLGRMPEGPTAKVNLEELLLALAALHSTEGIPIRVSCAGDPPVILGHHEVLDRVFRNLLVNAVEASQASGEGVDVILNRDGRQVRVSVLDRGAGIPDELLETIWLPDVTTKHRGTGLGLALVRQGVLAHGGEARARAREGGGAEFEVVLPLEVDPIARDGDAWTS